MTLPVDSTFQISGAEGEIIRGNVHLPSEDPGGLLPTVLLLHGFKGYKDYGFFPSFAQQLADAGRVVLRFNFSHSGIDDDPATFGRPDLFERDSWSKQLADVKAVVAAAQAGALPHGERMDLARLGLVGHSRGGVVALLFAADAPDIRAVVSLSAPDSSDMPEAQKQRLREQGYLVSPSSRTGQELRIGRDWVDDLDRNAARLDLLAAVSRLRVPLLIVHGGGDQTVPVSCARELAAAYPGDAELVTIDGAGHTFNTTNPFRGPTPAYQQMLAATTAFLQKHLTR
jgi:uncharacterized protein